MEVLEVFESVSNIVQDERVLGDLRVDGVGYMENGRISNLEVLELFESASNVVQDERVLGDLRVDGVGYGGEYDK